MVNKASSVGEDSDKVTGEEVFVVLGDAAASGVGEGEIALGKFLRLLLAVQMPKVITKPKAKPMAIARKTSFFIVDLG